MFEFRFPDVGEGIHEGHLIKWLVKEGDKVKEDQPLAEIETDKAVVEIPSPRKGTIAKLHFKAGDTIKVGEIIISIAEEGEKTPLKEKEEKKEAMKGKEIKKEEKKKGASVVGEISTEEKEIPPSSETQRTAFKAGKILASPKIKKLAEEKGIDLSKVQGTGKNNEVTEEDLQSVIKAGVHAEPVPAQQPVPETKISFDSHGRILTVPLSPTRKIIAKKMKEALMHIPFAVAMIEADVSKLAKVREKEKKIAMNKGFDLTYLPFIAKASVIALEKYPYVNSSLNEETETVILKQYYNIGVAVYTPAGLMVPVVKEANNKSILSIAKEIQRLAILARERKIKLEELKGGTFTITNYGSIAGSYGVPIINYPEAAILGVGRIEDKPVVRNGKIVIRKILPLSLSFDHRVMDGAIASRFLKEIVSHLEDPELLLIESG